jgi:4'-phosphopantetheinyl transferase
MTAPLFTYRHAHPDGLDALVAGEVRLWCVALDASPPALAQLASVLDEDEAMRASRFRFDKHRAEFIIARGLLRHLLARFTDASPAAIRFSYGPRGKPEMSSRPLRFNLSHSGGLVLYAFALDRELGVDIEHCRDMTDLESIARRFFATKEVDELLSLPLEERPAAFFRCWTRKESFVKAVGDGLYLPLDSFRVSLRPGEPASILEEPNDTGQRWRLTDVTPLEGYAAALITEGMPKSLTAFRAAGASRLLSLLES